MVGPIRQVNIIIIIIESIKQYMSGSGPVPGPGPFLVFSISLLFSSIQTRQTEPGGDAIFTLPPPTNPPQTFERL